MAYHSVGKNPYTMEMDILIEYMMKRKRVPRVELLSTFYPIATPTIVLELLGALMQMGRIAMDAATGDYVYTEKRKIIIPPTSVKE